MSFKNGVEMRYILLMFAKSVQAHKCIPGLCVSASRFMCVCVCRITQCCLVGETVRIQADYRGVIRSLRHADPVFY